MHHNLLFDLDQTLLDFHASERLGVKFVMEQKGLEFTEELYQSFKQINKSLWLEFEKGSITKPELFVTRFRRLFEQCDCDTDKMDLERINSDFIDHMSHHGVLLDGALQLLDNIRQSIPDVRVYIITNGVTRNACGRIASTGLNEYLSDVFVSEQLGTSKPAREFFDAVIKAIGEPAESCLVIGDSLTSDMLGAKNAGLSSCWFMPQGDIGTAVKEYDINYTASSFDELLGVIKTWADNN